MIDIHNIHYGLRSGMGIPLAFIIPSRQESILSMANCMRSRASITEFNVVKLRRWSA